MLQFPRSHFQTGAVRQKRRRSPRLHASSQVPSAKHLFRYNVDGATDTLSISSTDLHRMANPTEYLNDNCVDFYIKVSCSKHHEKFLAGHAIVDSGICLDRRFSTATVATLGEDFLPCVHGCTFTYTRSRSFFLPHDHYFVLAPRCCAARMSQVDSFC